MNEKQKTNQEDNSCCFSSETSQRRESTKLPKPSQIIENFPPLPLNVDDLENDNYNVYAYPFQISELNDKSLLDIACDTSVVALSKSGVIHVFGGLGREEDTKNILFAANFSLEHLGVRFERISSSGFELTAFDTNGKVYVNTIHGAVTNPRTPQKVLALSQIEVSSFSSGDNASAILTSSGQIYVYVNCSFC